MNYKYKSSFFTHCFFAFLLFCIFYFLFLDERLKVGDIALHEQGKQLEKVNMCIKNSL